jgi:CarD family transcriptional regulator
VKTIAKTADAAPKAAVAVTPANKQAAKPASAAPDKAVAAKSAADKAAQPQTAAVKAPAPVVAAPAPTKAPASPAPAAQVVSSAPKPALKSSQTQVGTVNLKKPQTANDSAPVSSSQTPAPAAAAKPAAKPGPQRTGFKSGEHIVYPAHGVGQIIAVEEQEVAGFKLELFVISFAKDKMTLKVPMPKVIAGAIRKLADAETVKKSLDTLTGRARIKRTMWSRRAQEYEAKINSGDLGSIAEVVRDLYRSEAQPEQSYSERQLYESALDRMAREIAAVQKLTDSEALKLIESHLQKGPKRGTKAEQVAEELAEEAVDGDIEQAA